MLAALNFVAAKRATRIKWIENIGRRIRSLTGIEKEAA
jgi:hypothetical protein